MDWNGKGHSNTVIRKTGRNKHLREEGRSLFCLSKGSHRKGRRRSRITIHYTIPEYVGRHAAGTSPAGVPPRRTPDRDSR